MDGSPADILLAHASRYPEMRPCDAVKLVYQNEFGNGHLVGGSDEVTSRLAAEYHNTARSSDTPLFETIGNRYRRLNLAALNADEPLLGTVARIFVESSKRPGDAQKFGAKLSVLKELTEKGAFNFTPEELRGYVETFDKELEPPRHSREYRKAYAPAYRVIDASFAELFNIILAVEELLKKGAALIAIDGRSASGKTTAAKLLQSVYGAAVIHMDDFFMPPGERQTGQSAAPGAHMDFARFNSQVAKCLADGRDIIYNKYDCGSGAYSDNIRQKASRVIIAEGAYSTHPAISLNYGLKIFFDIDPAEQKARIIKRNGKDGARAYFERWVPREEDYFKRCGIPQNCGVVIRGFGVAD